MDGRGEALLAEAEELRNRLEMVSQQLDLLGNLKEDKTRAHETLKGILGAKAGDEILFPVGGNTFVTATLGETKTVLKGVGADYAMQRPVETAIDELKGEMDTLDSDIQNLTRTAEQLESRYQDIAASLNPQGAGAGQPGQQ